MCGITGILGADRLDPQRTATVRQMTATLSHRGPDGEGFVSVDGCDLGFRRLAIVDVCAEARPFSNEDESIWSVCNGEIYNYEELRQRLEDRGHRLETQVDTELLPHLWEEYGPDLVDHLDGMFAFAVWDARRRTLLLGRDRAGEKPLFFWRHGDELVFASELRALLAHPAAPRSLDPVALRRFLAHGFFPAPLTPLHGIEKLEAGHVLVARDGDISVRRYWDLSDHFGQPALARRDPRDLARELDQRIALAVKRRSRSDVPVGVFLSGGIDSSSLLAYLTDLEGPGVPAFTLGHQDDDFDESRFAARTAEHFGAELHSLVLSETDLDDGLRQIGELFDEPLGDASIIPTLLLAQMARRHVKVVLSGEGADELLAGYPTYIGYKVAEAFRRLPASARSALLYARKKLTPVTMSNVGPSYLLARFADAADADSLERHHTWFGCLDVDQQRRVLSPRLLAALDGDDPFASARARLDGRDLPDGLTELLYADFAMYLQDGLLTKVDRATMLASLEARAPFLDHELMEFVAGLPSDLKLRGFTTKAILRRSVRGRLPAEVLKRRKRGFNIPFSRWLLHGLGDRLKERFSQERVAERGVFSPDGVAELLEEHLSRRADHRKPLFALLVFDLWCDRVFGEGVEIPIKVATAQEATVVS